MCPDSGSTQPNTAVYVPSTNSRALNWNPTANDAFIKIKSALANTTLLVHLKPDAPMNIMTDALDIAVGAVLQQYLD